MLCVVILPAFGVPSGFRGVCLGFIYFLVPGFLSTEPEGNSDEAARRP